MMTPPDAPAPMIWVLGEALIDFVPREIAGQAGYVPHTGGSPFNAAKAAALAGGRVAFVGGISTDFFGDMLVADLARCGVETSGALRSDAPSTLAFVTFEGGHPRYAFFNNLTSTALVEPVPRSATLAPGDVLSIGSIALIDRPGAENITVEALATASGALLAFDPNVRAGMVKNWPDWSGRMERLLARAGLVKLSTEDLEVLRPGMTATEFAAVQLAGGAALVVVTDGAAGAQAFAQSGMVSMPAPHVAVKDTVGAGDTLMGTLLAELCLRGKSHPAALAALSEPDLRQILQRAVVAAALNCTEVGCQPPRRAEVDRWMARRSADQAGAT